MLTDQPARIRARIGPNVLSRSAQLFDSQPRTIFSELLQNARRAGATKVDITVEADESAKITHVAIADNGRGVSDPQDLLTFGGSGWEQTLQDREHAAGMGFYALATYGATVHSGTWMADFSPPAFVGEEDVAIDSTEDHLPGTLIRFSIPWSRVNHRAIELALEQETFYFTIPVTVNGNPAKQVGFLDGAIATYDVAGVRIGVFPDPSAAHRLPGDRFGWNQPDVNFLGHAIVGKLPTIEEIGGLLNPAYDPSAAPLSKNQPFIGNARQFTPRIDIIDAPDLQLVLPTRDNVIQNDAWKAMLVEVERAMYQTIAALPAHMLGPKHIKRAAELGITIAPPAKLYFHPWYIQSADENTTYNGDQDYLLDLHATTPPQNVYLIPEELEEGDAPINLLIAEQLFDRELPVVLLNGNRRYEGFARYDALPSFTCELSVRVGDRTFRIDADDHIVDTNEDAETVLDAATEPTACDSIRLVDDIEAVLLFPDRDELRVPLDAYVPRGQERDDLSFYVRRDSDPAEIASSVTDAIWTNNDDDDSDAKDLAERDVRNELRKVLQPPTRAIGDAIRETLTDALWSYLSPSKDATSVRKIEFKIAERSQTTVVTFHDGSVYRHRTGQ